jgi:hypothetical protein
MGLFKFRLDVTPQNFEKLTEIRARLEDFSVVFSNIIDEWAKGNVKRKFARAIGGEKKGVDQIMTRWEPVSEAYYRQKHGPIVRGNRQLYPDWLMVKTGNLMNTLGTRGLFAEFIDKKRAVFGTPLNDEAEAAALGNQETRPTVFLDRTDRNVIRRELQQYLSLGENYKSLLWAMAGRKTALMKESRQLDIAFAETIGV